MKKKLSNKKTVLLLLVLFIVVSTVVYFIIDFSGSAGANENTAFNEDSNRGLSFLNLPVLTKDANNDEICHESATITYYTYDVSNKPFEVNNKFGLYIYAENENFFDFAEKMVNSNDGDWGYVLIPYNVKDRDYSKWRRVFNTLFDKHLIPIVQLHDIDTEDYKEQTKEAALFLDSFVWPVKQRYISVYNEPNDANFWYGRVSPDEYAQILDFTIETFKERSDDFFMLNGAFNVSAATTVTSLDSFEYMRLMNNEVPGIFNKLDGWASHSYPQPNFSGNPYSQGRWSIRAYDSELTYLRQNLGVTKTLPVFITETGWAHAEGESYNSAYLPVDTISDHFKDAYEDVWLKDDRVVAVTPFTIRYEPPFDHFSWITAEDVPYKHYETVKKINKTAGRPQMLVKKEFTRGNCAIIK